MANNASSKSPLGNYSSNVEDIYAVAVPCLIAFCGLVVCINCFIIFISFCSTQQGRRTLTLRLTLSLAGTDGWATFLMAAGFVINSYPGVEALKPRFPRIECYVYCFEALRLGGMLTSVLHILALTVNHYLAIAYPVVYRARAASAHKQFMGLIVLIWVGPPLLVMTIFLTHYNQIIRHPACWSKLPSSIEFRLSFFLIIFTVLLVITVVYMRMLTLLKRLQRHISEPVQQMELETLMVNENGETKTTSLSSSRSSAVAQKFLQRNMKMACTALLIVGTFLLGWIPNVLWFALTCNTCPFPILALRKYHYYFVSAIGIATNFLIILKGFLNPLIYAIRIPEIKTPLKSFFRRSESSNSRTRYWTQQQRRQS